MTVFDILGLVCILVGAVFFLAGTVGLVRFPDVYSRLHALTKADNLGLGLTIAGAALLSRSWVAMVELMVIWILILIASSVSCHLIARAAWRQGIEPWSKDGG